MKSQNKIILYTLLYTDKKNAGPKAPNDVIKIITENFNCEERTWKRYGNYKLKLLLALIVNFFKKNYIIIQYPCLYKPSVYKISRSKKKILFIHDINGLRNNDEELLKKELKIFNTFENLIVHNNKMKQFLIENNIDKHKIYTLELFDYLCLNTKHSKKSDEFSITYAGNLKKEKSPFIYQLDDEKLKYKINLYGLGVSKNISEKLVYRGSFDPDDLSMITGNVGLVWDGNYDESDADTGFKNYTKFNNPHKLSCYIAAGLPVIVWEKSAIAEFVLNNNIGYVISNIYDINSIDFSDYNTKKANVNVVSKRIRKGYYTKRVLNNIFNKKN